MNEFIGDKCWTTSFVRRRNLPNLIGRIDYISNPKRQEFLKDFYDMEDKDFWRELAKQSKEAEDYNKNKVDRKGKPFKTIQAVEYMIRLSPELCRDGGTDLIVPAKRIADSFYQKFGYKCCVAIHHSKLKDANGKFIKDENGDYIPNTDNLHCHLIMCDREVPKENIKKYAKRDIYYDSNGKRVYNKKLADPTKTIKKGDCYINNVFGKKIEEIRDFKAFNAKMHDWSNEFNNEHSDVYYFYRPNNVGYGKDYEPQKKVGNNRPEKSARYIKARNKEIQKLNMVKRFAIKDVYSHDPLPYYGFKYDNEQLFRAIDIHLPKANEKTKRRLYSMACYINRNAKKSDQSSIRRQIPSCTLKGYIAYLSQNQKRIEEEIEKYLKASMSEEYDYSKGYSI